MAKKGRTAKPKKEKKEQKPLTTAQRLSGLIKSCRDTMRKDKGLNGDADRLPILTWVIFLKFLDDAEAVREAEAKLDGKKYKPLLQEPYHWRDWAMNAFLTGDDLKAFINNDRVTYTDNRKISGLLHYLRSLQSADGQGREDVIARVFKGVSNRMESGTLFEKMVDKIAKLNFASSEEIFTLAHLYESLLKEMRDAAGDAGEFYTPRPVVRIMVELTDPKPGETVLDPAAGTGGFLVEAFEYMRKQCQSTQDLKRYRKKGYVVERLSRCLTCFAR